MENTNEITQSADVLPDDLSQKLDQLETELDHLRENLKIIYTNKITSEEVEGIQHRLDKKQYSELIEYIEILQKRKQNLYKKVNPFISLQELSSLLDEIKSQDFKEVLGGGKLKRWATLSVEDVYREMDEDLFYSEKNKLPQVLFKSLQEIHISERLRCCLKNGDIHFLWQLVTKNADELLKVRRLGVSSLAKIKKILDDLDLELDMSFTEEELKEFRDVTGI